MQAQHWLCQLRQHAQKLQRHHPKTTYVSQAYRELHINIGTQLPRKKPIYSTPVANTTPKYQHGISDPLTHTPPSVPEASTPTPTDRLEKQIRRARLWLHGQTVAAENQFNRGLTWAFKKETNIANTIASLAPSAESGEQLLPGLIYVLVATMAGSIVSRNRNILIRATFPVAVGVTAGELSSYITLDSNHNRLDVDSCDNEEHRRLGLGI